MQLARVATISDWEVSMATPWGVANKYYQLDTRYVLRVLHFSAFHLQMQIFNNGASISQVMYYV